jgi:predicted phosphoadenosine phosphosulfate sulfurtransferase
VPKKLHDAGKAPSYKAIAIAILKNDLHLYSLGFRKRDSQIVNQLVDDAKARERRAEIGPGLFDDELL